MTLLLFILILSLLIFVHEFGHFIVAKKSGIKVEEFGFGLPPRLFGKKLGETIYSINLLPIGGFVRLLGENGEDDIAKKENKKRAFFYKKLPIRLLVLVAGVTMNLLLGIVCFSIIYLKLGIPTRMGKVVTVEVISGSPAQVAGIEKDETIFRVNNETVTSSNEFIDKVKSFSGNEIEILIGNDQQTRLLKVTPRINPPDNEGPLGVVITDTQMEKYPWWQMPYLTVREGMKEALSWSGNILGSLKTMLVGIIIRGEMPTDVAGPIGIYQIAGQAAQAGWLAVVQFIGILSINLAVLNILPLPALDGGRIVFLAYEGIFRKRPSGKIEGIINSAGMIFLLGLMAVITINDIIRLVVK